ncbi:hypothetical protein [Fluviicola taffensis]|jgi:hypothetical protein|uniref:Uncharacterized protein n=1 Tax=Fluviicola taffensis (strain DSM 16823 / NCIMB 13979 / RW262) TaxID=755732 RepID=F2IDG9_FLUTR|nr:hypothetical protein [Fluviicola taffensis]AEA42345.1 hypothetical protein Fluta_0337 [Fluviicola taffensis DSM 16823]
MKQIVNDWDSFCKGNNAFEDSYFYTLFMEGVSVEEIEAIYNSFPNSAKLVERMKRYLFTETSNFSIDETRNQLDKLIRLDFEDRKSVLGILPNFSHFNKNPKFTYTDDLKMVSNLILDDIWVQDFHDYMRMQKIITDKKVYELNNALYGLTYDFDYQLFLFQPLLNTPYTADYLFQFKKIGGIYAITKEEVFYTSTKSPAI